MSDLNRLAFPLVNMLLLSRGVSPSRAYAGLPGSCFRTIGFHQRDVRTGTGPTQPRIVLLPPATLDSNITLSHRMIIQRRLYRRRSHTCSTSAPLLSSIHFPALTSDCLSVLFVRILVVVDFGIGSCLQLVDIGQSGTKEKRQ